LILINQIYIVEETMEALNDLVRSGKVRYIGASSMYAWQFAKAQHVAEKNGWTKFVSMQNHYNLVYREEEREMNPLCVDQGVGLIPWSPLARGFLAGNRSKVDVEKEKNEGNSATKRAQTDALSHQYYYADSDFEIVERLKTVAEKKQVKPAQIALAWILSKPGVSAPIIGASKMYQLEEAVGAASIQLSEEEIKTLEELYQPHRILGHW
jgi:aryl-alcohol dehydrogenase-like predicted oxidoreductase